MSASAATGEPGRAAGRPQPRCPVDVAALVLWPGAGSSADHPSFDALAAGLAPLPVRRFDFPYRREGRTPPDRADRLIRSLRADVEGVCEELGVPPERLVLGGRSMGGRMASMAVAGATGATRRDAPRWEPPLPAAGLVLLGYPLHPPKQPERLRAEHLEAISVPTLFISGDRDPFGTPDELAAAQRLVAGPVSSVTLAGARHELAGADDRVVEVVGEWLGLDPPR